MAHSVMPAQAGIQGEVTDRPVASPWTSAFAEVTTRVNPLGGWYYLPIYRKESHMFHHLLHHGRRFGHPDFDPPHGMGHRHRGRHGHGHGRGGRMFDYGELRPVLLALIAERPSHGYELIKAIEDRTGGAYTPSAGVIYPTLAQLEDQGFVRVEPAEGGRKRYEATEPGREHLAANVATVQAAFARIDDAGAASAGMRAPQLVRARENLKLALRLRLARGNLTPDAVEAIAAALDAAATAIERS